MKIHICLISIEVCSAGFFLWSNMTCELQKKKEQKPSFTAHFGIANIGIREQTLEFEK